MKPTSTPIRKVKDLADFFPLLSCGPYDLLAQQQSKALSAQIDSPEFPAAIIIKIASTPQLLTADKVEFVFWAKLEGLGHPAGAIYQGKCTVVAQCKCSGMPIGHLECNPLEDTDA